MAVCIHEMSKSITIQHVVGTAVDAHGHIDKTTAANWGTYIRAFAKVISKGGREFWKVQQVNADVDHVWTVPYSSQVASATPDMRLTCDGVTYEIQSVVDVDLAHREVQIQTRRAV